MPGMNLSGLPKIRSYEDAADWLRKNAKSDHAFWDDTNVPLDGTRKRHVQLFRAGQALVCRLYCTDVVTYYPDGKIRVEFYNTQATCEFVNSLTPDCISAFIRHGEMWLQFKELGGRTVYLRPDEVSILFVPSANGGYVFSGELKRKAAIIEHRKLHKIVEESQQIVDQLACLRRLGAPRMYRSGPWPIEAIKRYLETGEGFNDAFGSFEAAAIPTLIAVATGRIELAGQDYSLPPAKRVGDMPARPYTYAIDGATEVSFI